MDGWQDHRCWICGRTGAQVRDGRRWMHARCVDDRPRARQRRSALITGSALILFGLAVLVLLVVINW